MRQLAIHLLNVYRKTVKTWQRLRGQTAASIAEQRVLSGETWEEFCDTLKAAGASLKYPGTPQDSHNQAEGYRYLSRLARAGLEAFIEYADPAMPQLRRMVHETVKMGADNPDNYYQNCVVDGQYDYRISGTRGTVFYLSFATKSGHYGDGGGMPAVAEIDADTLEINPDGTFELHLSQSRKPGNWLKLPDGEGLLIVRQTFMDRRSEHIAELLIECCNGPRPGYFDAQKLDAGLQSAGMLVAGASLLFSKWTNGFRKHSNILPMFDPEMAANAGGDPNIVYYHSHWHVPDDHALVVEAMPPECEYWNFQLNNYWMESLDYTRHRIHINKHLAAYNPDGSVTVVIAHQDPDHPNWLETAGHYEGTMCWRWIKAQTTPQPRSRVLALRDVPAYRATCA